MTRRICHRRRGVVLLEWLVYAAIITVVAVGAMRVVGDARMLRANGRERTRMALIAQEELDRARLGDAASLAAGVRTAERPEWPKGTKATTTLTKRDDGHWTAEVRVERESLEGKPAVSLATVIAGARQ